jgi:transcription elongation GreA/GreB family factor
MADEIQNRLTLEAYDRLDAELHELVNVVRPEISKRIQEAREEGDLKENGGYHAAREEQGIAEARISKLEKLLKSAIITNGREANLLENLANYRLEAWTISKEVLFFAAVLDFVNSQKEVEPTVAGLSEALDSESSIENADEAKGLLNSDRYNQIHLQYRGAAERLQNIVDNASLKDSDYEFFKAQLDRSIFYLNEALRLDSNYFVLALIPKVRESLTALKIDETESTPDDINEATFQIVKVLFKKSTQILFPEGKDSNLTSQANDSNALSTEGVIKALLGVEKMDSELRTLLERLDALTAKLSELVATRGVILSQGRITGDSSLEMLDSYINSTISQIQVTNYKIAHYYKRVRSSVSEETSDPSEVTFGMVITIELNGKQLEFLLGSAEMAENTDLTVYSPDSPMGNAIIGAKIGESVSYTAPTGKELTVKIVAVKHFEG